MTCAGRGQARRNHLFFFLNKIHYYLVDYWSNDVSTRYIVCFMQLLNHFPYLVQVLLFGVVKLFTTFIGSVLTWNTCKFLIMVIFHREKVLTGYYVPIYVCTVYYIGVLEHVKYCCLL